MPRTILILLITFFAAAFDTHADEARLNTEWQKKEVFVTPGNVVNLVYFIDNPGTTAYTLIPDLILPPGIRLAIPLKEIEVLPNKRKMDMVTLSIPRNFPAGLVPISLILRKSNSDSIISRITATVDVGISDRLTLDLAEMETYIMAGEQIRATYLLKNHGNIRRKLLIRTYRCNVNVSPVVELDPGETRIIEVTAPTDKKATRTHSQSFSIQAILNDDLQVSDFREIKVYPKAEVKEDIYMRYPVTLSTRYLSRNQDGDFKDGYQFEAIGNGNLDESGKHKLEFLARGPNNRDLSFLGMYDEYYITYKNRNSETFLGDKSYSLTPLTEYTRYGTGAEQTFITNKGSRVGGFYMEPRFYRNISREIAAYGSLMLKEGNYLGLNYLTKTIGLTGEEAVLSSITAGLAPFTDTRLELEYSRGTYRDKKDDAFRILINSHFKNFSFSGNLINAGEFFPGYYSNSLFYYGNLYVRISNALSLNFTAREDFTEAATDTLLATAPYSKIIQASANFRLSRTSDIRAFYMNYQRKDRMPVKQFDYSTESMNIWLSQNFNKFNYQMGAELGKTQNLMFSPDAGNGQNSYRLSLNLNYRPTYKLNLQAFAYYTNINSYIASGQKNFLFGGSAYGQLTNNLKANFQIQNTFGIEDYYLNRNLFQLALDYKFLKRHTISLHCFYTLFQRQTAKADFSGALTYSVNIGVPLKKQKELGSVRGKLVRSNGEPVQGALVYLGGQSAITRGNGEFTIINLKPGEYSLLIDRKQLDMNDILDVNLPVMIEVRHAEETYKLLTIVKGSRIQGNISVSTKGNGQGIRDDSKPPLGNIVVELANEKGNKKLLTNDNGTFDFSGIRPGKWTLTVHRNNIDPRYVPDQEKFEIELNEGDITNIDVTLVSRARNIIFNSTQVIVSSKPQVHATDVKSDITEAEFHFQPDDIWFGVQISAGSRRPQIKPDFNGNSQGVHEIFINGMYKYIVGTFKTAAEARKYSVIVKRYFSDAFIVAFEGDDQISVSEAIEKQKQKL